MILSNASAGENYRVLAAASFKDGKEKLYKLGILPGVNLKLVQKNFRGAVIIDLRGARYAISPALSGKIIVENAELRNKK